MFKFDEYPEIKKAHREQQRLEKIADKLDSKIKDYDKKSKEIALEASNVSRKYDTEVFAPLVFYAFKNIKPKLYNRRDKKYRKWETVFASKWEDITIDQNTNLLGLVLEIGYGIYRLPEEYYNDIPLLNGFPMPIG